MIRQVLTTFLAAVLLTPSLCGQALPLTRPTRPPRIIPGDNVPPVALQINSSAVGGAIQGQAYSGTLATNGGTAPFVWTVTAGALPANLTLNSSSGIISGTPTAAGSSTFTIGVSDVSGKTASKPVVLMVSPSGDQYGNTGDPYASEGGIPDASATVLMACTGTTALSANTSYRLGQNVSAASAADRCFTLATGVKLDLAGFTVTGSIKFNGNPNGLRVFNGTINCSVVDTGNVPGCFSISSGAGVTTPPRIHHLTITNTGTGTRAIHIDWPLPSTVTGASIQLYNLTIFVPPQPSVPRSYAISFQGIRQSPEYFNNDVTCSPEAGACQGMMCYATADCKVHHNRVNLPTNTSGADTARGILFDGVGQAGEAWNNLIDSHNNRGIRVRGTTNVRIHDNRFVNIEENGSGVIHLADPASTETNNLNTLVDNNDFELAGGTIIFIRNGINAVVRDNRFTCSGLSCNASRLAWVRSPLTPGTTFSELTVQNNPNVILYVSPAQNRVDSGAVLSICNSGQASGTGTVSEATCP